MFANLPVATDNAAPAKAHQSMAAAQPLPHPRISHPPFDLKVVPVHGAEKFLTAVLAGWLIFLPLAFGTRDVWSQIVAFGLAALAFASTCLPRPLPPLAGEEGAPVVRAPIVRLSHSPSFWLTVALLLYAALQSLNPAWQYFETPDGGAWGIRQLFPLAGIPAGIDAPFAQMNGWRQVFIWGSPLLAGAAAWAGLTRRKTVHVLLTLFVLNALLVGALGVAQRLTDTKLIYWHYAFHGAEPYGSFVYKNHAAAYLLIGLAACGGLAGWHYFHGRRTMARSTPAPVFVLLGAVLLVSIFLSQSRLGTLLAAGVMLALAALVILRLRGQTLSMGVALLTIVAAAGLSLAALNSFDTSRARARFAAVLGSPNGEVFHTRVLAGELTRRMIVDHPAFGVGAGAYRYHTPTYMRDLPHLAQRTTYYHHRPISARYQLNHAHNDHLQLLAEFGLVGGTLAYLLAACGLAALLDSPRRRHPMGSAALVGFVALLGYAAVDFPLQNPAVLSTFVVFLVLSCRWADLESRRTPAG